MFFNTTQGLTTSPNTTAPGIASSSDVAWAITFLLAAKAGCLLLLLTGCCSECPTLRRSSTQANESQALVDPVSNNPSSA